jgi:enoyl-CoA hydratase
MSHWSFSIGDDSVAVITFTSSKKDASLSLAVVDELADLLESAARARERIAVIVLAGEGGSFLPDADRAEISRLAEGVEVSELSGDPKAWYRAGESLRSLRQPSVAVIDGPASGGACLLALACTFRIASERSVFGPVDLSLGIVGTHSSAHLVRLVGPTIAAELLLRRSELDAPVAKQIGLLSEVLPDEGFDAQARQWCEAIATLPRETVFAVKQAVEGSTATSRDDILATLPPNSRVPTFR